MKSFGLLLLSALMMVCVFVSCGDGDEDNNDSALLGTWVTDSYSSDVITNDPEATRIIKLYIEEDNILWGVYTFMEGGKAVNKHDEDIITDFSYKTEDDIVIFTAKQDGVTMSQKFTYSISNNVLTLSRDVKSWLTKDYLEQMGITDAESLLIEKAVQNNHLVKN